MATIAELQQQLDAQQAQLAATQETIQKAYSTSADALKTLINARTVGINDKLGALSAADSLATAPVGDQATVRNAIGALANEDVVTFKKVSSRSGLELLGTAYIDWHFGDDADDYSSRLIATAKYQLWLLSNLSITGNVDQTGNLNVGGRITGGGLGGYAYSGVVYNGYGTVAQKLIADVTGKNLAVGRVCQAWEMNAWDGNADNSWVAGTWLCTSQLALPGTTSHLCTFVKNGD